MESVNSLDPNDVLTREKVFVTVATDLLAKISVDKVNDAHDGKLLLTKKDIEMCERSTKKKMELENKKQEQKIKSLSRKKDQFFADESEDLRLEEFEGKELTKKERMQKNKKKYPYNRRQKVKKRIVKNRRRR